MIDYYDVYELPHGAFIMRASLAQLSFAYKLRHEAIMRIRNNGEALTDLHNSRDDRHVLVVPVTDGWTPPPVPTVHDVEAFNRAVRDKVKKHTADMEKSAHTLLGYDISPTPDPE